MSQDVMNQELIKVESERNRQEEVENKKSDQEEAKDEKGCQEKAENGWNHQQKAALEQVGSRFSFYGLVSLVVGICYSFCLYKNPGGVLVPVFVMIYYGAALLVLKKMEIEVKKESYVLIGISVLIGCSTCRTASDFFGL